MTTPKIAVCFFGITRSLSRTVGSIQENVIEPAQATGLEVMCYGHFFKQGFIDNPRSDEAGKMNLDEHRLLEFDGLKLEEPDECLSIWGFEVIKAFGSPWDDNFRSLRNLIHQLHSLNEVTEMAFAGGADIVIFARPDMTYHDSLSQPLKYTTSTKKSHVQLPWWQPFGGLNDRFAIARGERAIRAYGQRIHQVLPYCETNGPLHAERLVRFTLERAKVPVRTISARASRTRIDGTSPKEPFHYPRRYEIKRRYPMAARLVKIFKSGSSN